METSVFYQSQLDVLINIPLSASVNHQLYFDSDSARDNYFNGHIYRSWDNFKYLRESNVIKIQGIETEFYHTSYMRFKNNETNGMWIYAFIINTEYINQHTTALHYKIDPWQTYYSSLEIRNCDIERMHLSTGEMEKWNTYITPESFMPSDNILSSDDTMIAQYKIDGAIIMSTIDLITSGGTIDNPEINTARGGYYNGLPSACALYFTPDLSAVMEGLLEFPWVANGIIGIYAFSSELLRAGYTMTSSKMGFSIGLITKSEYPYFETKSIDNFLNYLPPVKNKKLFIYPYCYIEIVSPDGNEMLLKPEMINGNNINLKIICTLVPTPAIHISVDNYLNGNQIDLYNSCLTFSQFPSFPCINDQYTLAKEQSRNMDNLVASQNKYNLQRQLIGSFGSIIGSGFGGVGSVITTTVGEASSLASNARAEQQRAERARLNTNQMTSAPALAGQSTAGSCAPVISYTDNFSFLIRFYSTPSKERGNFDDYLSAYGYKLNEIKTPDLTAGGKRYKYIKCNHVNMYGNIPAEFLEEIRSMFLTGITFWYDHENVGVY